MIANFFIMLISALVFKKSSTKVLKMETVYLPFSDTEDVDYTLNIPQSIDGCFRWMSNDETVIELTPILKDYSLQCGTQLEFSILQGETSEDNSYNINITAKSVLNPEVEYTYPLVVTPVNKIQIISEQTVLKVTSGSVMFGVVAYDADGNEFDTLDGVNITWFIGADSDIAKIEGRANGPVVYVSPLSHGTGQLIAMIKDATYENVEETSVKISIISE